jgi:hypothetical protein
LVDGSVVGVTFHQEITTIPHAGSTVPEAVMERSVVRTLALKEGNSP